MRPDIYQSPMPTKVQHSGPGVPGDCARRARESLEVVGVVLKQVAVTILMAVLGLLLLRGVMVLLSVMAGER